MLLNYKLVFIVCQFAKVARLDLFTVQTILTETVLQLLMIIYELILIGRPMVGER